ncbi:hypothetical protein EDD11_003089 [Mortierella claussenii]|nr:hypothetical protein EDD11_003089 [Mortierella claussenii]
MDPDDVGAQQWQNTANTQEETVQVAPLSECDDYWFIPPYVDSDSLMDQLETFGRDTATHMAHNHNEERIELWGPTSCIQKAKQALDHFAAFYHELSEKRQKGTRSRGWAKPDRELTPAEKKKKERKDRKQMESQKHLGVPTEELPFNHCIKWPKDLPIHRLLGGNLQLLDPLRTEFRCFIWLEHPDMFYIAGSNEESTFTAFNRIKTYMLKRIRPPVDTVCHVLEKPSKLVQIETVRAPRVPYIRLPFQMSKPLAQPYAANNPMMHMRAKPVAGYENLLELDLKMAAIELDNGPGTLLHSQSQNVNKATKLRNAAQTGAVSQNDDHIKSMEYIGSMTERNIGRIRQALEAALDQVQLLDGEIQMCIRFGHVGLLEYPKKALFDVQELDVTVIRDSRLKTEFGPFFTNSSERFAALIRKLGPADHTVPTKPTTLWSLGILKKDEYTNAALNVQLDVTFREDGKVALWNALAQKATPLSIRVISSERIFSWAWTISTGRRLEADKFSPEGKFVHRLSLDKSKGEDGKLVFANTEDVQLRHIRREKKWQFHRDPWIIELKEEAFWSPSDPSLPFQFLTLSAPPDEILYSVAMLRESWVVRFSENPHLGLGQVPYWNPSDFFEGDELISKTMESASEIRSLIEELF